MRDALLARFANACNEQTGWVRGTGFLELSGDSYRTTRGLLYGTHCAALASRGFWNQAAFVGRLTGRNLLPGSEHRWRIDLRPASPAGHEPSEHTSMV